MPEMIVGQIDQIVIRRLNDFIPDTDSPLILDCGANIGISALHFKRCFPKARIIAFEPDPALFAVLRSNLDRNDAADVQAVQAAVWTHTRGVSFAADGADGGRIYAAESGDRQTDHVPSVDLRDYLTEPVDLLKLDIEGAEYTVVPQALKRLSKVQNIVAECHINQSTLVSFGALLRHLRDAGFQTTFNTFGQWRDLVRRKPIEDSYYFEQYVAVYGWRTDRSNSASSCLPYLDLSVLMDVYREHNARRGPAQYRRSKKARWAKMAANAVALERPFNADGGACWTVRLPSSIADGDTQAQPNASRLVVFEEGEVMGPPHTEHAVIRKYGGGRFSHWCDVLYFSTSDGSDPNANGKTYAVAVADTE